MIRVRRYHDDGRMEEEIVAHDTRLAGNRLVTSEVDLRAPAG